MLIRRLTRRSASLLVQSFSGHLSEPVHKLSTSQVLLGAEPACWSVAFCSRGFAAEALKRPEDSAQKSEAALTQADARSILQNVQVQQFRQHLLSISENQISIPVSEIVAECQKHGAASTKEDAERICKALESAGITLRLANQVYLRPEEVAEMVIQAVPNTQAEIEAKLKNLKAQLEPMEEVKVRVDHRIQRRTRIVIWLALAGFVTQWMVFLRLTFWELSWDVMEPITYFTSSLFSICAYTYFIGTNREFNYKDATSHLRSRWEEKEYRTLRMDPDRYQQLVKDVHRYQRYLAAKAAH